MGCKTNIADVAQEKCGSRYDKESNKNEESGLSAQTMRRSMTSEYEKAQLLSNLDKVHTTVQGNERVCGNLGITCDGASYCKKLVAQKDCVVERQGKNYYATVDDVQITINAYSYTIITAHKCAKKG